MSIDPNSLPVYRQRDEILDAVRQHRVVVVQGPPGSGKTTQLPRLLAAAGMVPRRMGVTQPRRIAAVSVAWRIAAEESSQIGDAVGYAIRFDDATSAKTRIKVMTDGILLQEARTDPLLSAYDIIMIDEAHERSLNIDFAMGLLHRVLEQRDDLKVVISSATLDPIHFQRFFRRVAPVVPVVVVHTRTFPLRIHHTPIGGYSPEKIAEAVADRVEAIHRGAEAGHILAFLPGEGIITRIEQALAARRLGRGLWVLPLYGRLTREEQERVFEEMPERRKVILSTNIAETSITIDGVHFVIDVGMAKLPWFNPETGVTTLREEPVSRASAAQRAGRAGRVGPGQVWRLYSEESMAKRADFTPEEILRVDLSEAVLRLIDLGVTDVESFPFPTAPPAAKLRAAIDSLTAMGAIDGDRRLTDIGRKMAPFPLAPAMARMVVEAAGRFPDAVSDVLLVGAYLSVRSPFNFPPGHEEAARAAHRKLADPLGDAITGVRLYRAWQAAPDREAFCKQRFVDPDGLTFIERAHAQLADIAEQHGVPAPDGSGDPQSVVRCLACGFADRVIMLRGDAFVTLGGLRVAIHPSSSLYRAPPRFGVAAEFVSSGRTYAFSVSALQREWLAEVSPLAARTWLKRRGRSGAEPHAAARVGEQKAPTEVVLGAIRLAVQSRRHRPYVEIPLARVAALTEVPATAVPPAAIALRCKVLAGSGETLMRGELATVLRLLPLVPWPDAPTTGELLRVPLGALLELDRNAHAIGRHLPLLLSPMSGRQVDRPGWLSLIYNGGTGFWFDIVPDYLEALAGCRDALDGLRDGVGAGSDLLAEAARLAGEMAEQAARLARSPR